jgi:large subunit ribosomal protein L19
MSDEINKNEEAVNETPAVETPAAEEAPAQPAAPTVRKKNTLADVNALLLQEQNNKGRFPVFNIGDTVRVFVKIKEGQKERVQPYEGVVMALRHGGVQESFIVRRISQSVAIERIFPLHSPYLEKIEVVRRGRVRRAKLYYLRGRFGRAAKITEKVGIHNAKKAAADSSTEVKE